MKKIYQTPAMQTVRMEMETMIAESIPTGVYNNQPVQTKEFNDFEADVDAILKY